MTGKADADLRVLQKQESRMKDALQKYQVVAPVVEFGPICGTDNCIDNDTHRYKKSFSVA